MQRALVGLGTAARELQARDAHLDGLSTEQRAAVLAGPSHVRHAPQQSHVPGGTYRRAHEKPVADLSAVRALCLINGNCGKVDV